MSNQLSLTLFYPDSRFERWKGQAPRTSCPQLDYHDRLAVVMHCASRWLQPCRDGKTPCWEGLPKMGSVRADPHCCGEMDEVSSSMILDKSLFGSPMVNGANAGLASASRRLASHLVSGVGDEEKKRLVSRPSVLGDVPQRRELWTPHPGILGLRGPGGSAISGINTSWKKWWHYLQRGIISLNPKKQTNTMLYAPSCRLPP